MSEDPRSGTVLWFMPDKRRQASPLLMAIAAVLAWTLALYSLLNWQL